MLCDERYGCDMSCGGKLQQGNDGIRRHGSDAFIIRLLDCFQFHLSHLSRSLSRFVRCRMRYRGRIVPSVRFGFPRSSETRDCVGVRGDATEGIRI